MSKSDRAIRKHQMEECNGKETQKVEREKAQSKKSMRLKDDRIISIGNGKWMCKECNEEIENIRGAPGHLQKHQRARNNEQQKRKKRKITERATRKISEQIKEIEKTEKVNIPAILKTDIYLEKIRIKEGL